MKRDTPTERKIADLFAPAYERWAEPDTRRLAAIEQRLLEQPRLRGRRKSAWWWLIGALVAGAASALWWSVDYDSGKGRKGPVPALTSPLIVPMEAGKPTPPGKSVGTESKNAGEPVQNQGPVIYQRER